MSGQINEKSGEIHEKRGENPFASKVSNFDLPIQAQICEILQNVLRIKKIGMEETKTSDPKEVKDILHQVVELAQKTIKEKYEKDQSGRSSWLVVCSPLLFAKGNLVSPAASFGVFTSDEIDFLVINS